MQTWKRSENARNMQHNAQQCAKMHKIECSKSKTISRMAKRFLLFLSEGSNGKGWNICTFKKISEEDIATTRPWEPPCLSGGTAGRPTLCRAEHAKLQNMRRWFERIIIIRIAVHICVLIDYDHMARAASVRFTLHAPHRVGMSKRMLPRQTYQW